MIFLTVGTQLPFDRFVQLVDSLATETDEKIVAQVGQAEYCPENLEWKRFYKPDEMDEIFRKARVVVSHAGMGSIINCMRNKKPIIIFPRLSSLGEHRNDHQLDTVMSFADIKGVYPAYDENELKRLLLDCQKLEKPEGLKSPERQRLCEYILSLLK